MTKARKAFEIKASITNRSKNIQRYFNELNHNIDTTPISKELELELIAKAQNGCDKSTEKLVHSNLRFVVSFAKSFCKGNVAFQLEDLIQEANIGLLYSIKNYNLEKYNYKLFSYGVFWMRQKITNSLEKNMNAIRIPSNGVKESALLSKTKDAFLSEFEREPTIEELELITKCPIEKIRNLKAVSYTGSLDQPLGDEVGCGTRIDRISVEDKNFNSMDGLKIMLMPYLNELKDRQRYVLKALFGIDRSKATIQGCADELGLTRERIKQLKKSSLEKLRNLMGNNNELISFL